MRGAAARIARALNVGFENATLRPVVGAALDLADAPEAHRRIMQPGARGKIVLRTG